MIIKIYVDDIFIYNVLFNYIIIDLSCFYCKRDKESRLKKLIVIAVNSIIGTVIALYYYSKKIEGLSNIDIISQLLIPVILCGISSLIICFPIKINESIIKDIAKMSLVMYFFTLFLGGIISYLYINNALVAYIRIKMNRIIRTYPLIHLLNLIVIASFSLFISRLIKIIIKKIILVQVKNRAILDVIVINKGVEIKMKALLDTGNNLVEPITKKAVSVVEADVLRRMGNQKIEKMYCIPYISVGANDKSLYAIIVDKLIIITNNEQFVENDAMLGIYNGKLSSKDEFSMIINNVYCSKL